MTEAEDPTGSEDRTVAAGEAFPIDLPVSGGTGYRWELADAPPTVEYREQDTGPGPGRGSSADHGATEPGAPVHQRFVLRATSPGTGVIELDFVLRRPWESEPIAHRLIRIQVV
ncbi:Chagasin family peptidase inhibitor I42 [Raineyella antarctica]|uniref:Chagasin family peptidase inhibitor I42 n=1 Tax=Raineyella antarctica TaxID=1577474 RepID=A0A1G6HHH4_9ACTN|nr:protease inhibitor I42 family protein [Raineyella antarctica]SDB93709.1 Chagasin family peptidase inhibitor I42 [Raineyella antarctica]